MTVLLDDSVAVAGNPEVVIGVERTSVQARHGHSVRVAPARDQVAVHVEHQDVLRRHRASLRLVFGDIASIEDDDVVVGVDADPRQLPVQPPLGQGPGPIRIDFEPGRLLRCEVQAEQAQSDQGDPASQ